MVSRNDKKPIPPTLALTLLLALGGGLAGCTTTSPGSPLATSSSAAAADARLDAEVATTLSRLYQVVAGSRDMVARSAGVLVFPKVIGASLIIGGDHGQGALLVGGHHAGYYSTTGASIGWQAGAQSKSVIYVFNSAEALRAFQASRGWTVGIDAKVAVGHIGANGLIDSQTLARPVTSFVMNNAGVEGGVSLDGSKISRSSP